MFLELGVSEELPIIRNQGMCPNMSKGILLEAMMTRDWLLIRDDYMYRCLVLHSCKWVSVFNYNLEVQQVSVMCHHSLDSIKLLDFGKLFVPNLYLTNTRGLYCRP